MSHYDCPCMEKCPLHYAMSLIGGKWKVQILCSVTNAGTIRYNALRGKLDGISNTVLSSALRELERDGLILRREYLEVPVRVEYAPTEDCRRLLPILEQLSDWAEARMPAAWNRLYKEYLGVDVPSDREGVLQDSHWANGNIGYFPSYAIGSAYGAQYLLEMQKDLDVEAAVRSGKLTAINRWLEEKIWKYGCMKDPVALFESVCGPFRPEEYVAYLEKKFTEIYEL